MASHQVGGEGPTAEAKSFDLGRLSRGEWICGVAGLMMLIATSMTWLRSSEEGPVPVGGAFETSSHSDPTGWATLSGAWEIVVVLAILGGIGVAVLSAIAHEAELPVSRGTAVMALGGLALIAAINSYNDYSELEETLFATKEAQAGLGLFLAAAVALAVGGWVLRREDHAAGTA